MKKRKKQVFHDVYIDTRDLKHLRNTSIYGSFQSFRPRLVEVLDAAGDLPESKGLYACFKPLFYYGLEQISEVEEGINSMPGADLLRCKGEKRRFFPGTSWSSGISALVRLSNKNTALELFDRLSNKNTALEPLDSFKKAEWIDYAILDNKWCDRLIETYPGYDILDFASLEALMRESDHLIYSVVCDFCIDPDEFSDDYYEIIAYGVAAPAALRQLVNTWGIPSSYQRPGNPYDHGPADVPP